MKRVMWTAIVIATALWGRSNERDRCAASQDSFERERAELYRQLAELDMAREELRETHRLLEVARTNVSETEKQCAIALSECFDQRDEARKR
jgi:hypothetical protein